MDLLQIEYACRICNKYHYRSQYYSILIIVNPMITFWRHYSLISSMFLLDSLNTKQINWTKFSYKISYSIGLQLPLNKINIITYFENITIGLYVFYTINTYVKFCVNRILFTNVMNTVSICPMKLNISIPPILAYCFRIV